MSLLFHRDKQGVRVSVHKREFVHKITRQRNELTSSNELWVFPSGCRQRSIEPCVVLGIAMMT